ncbi:hypothetical protein ASPWEDRAFT_578170 [Aspergillus wentii DTO 134E9]|uniref:Uncharacterized protein n=1 Tax=Aspergillus wentii DTO 134E9 TaxID=1073089 RepID=A0A1L9RHB6_ASPWE|nr:uncharacterized protein ASPWEDRAFT_578170 [Aspergillus wentii DTO 134E9]OJJ34330.1 hypothetical protein ASPWEDRAFT_578170 [Aspergillus wentii DTO 134E9]
MGTTSFVRLLQIYWVLRGSNFLWLRLIFTLPARQVLRLFFLLLRCPFGAALFWPLFFAVLIIRSFTSTRAVTRFQLHSLFILSYSTLIS